MLIKSSQIASFQNELLELHIEGAYPPGSPIAFSLETEGGEKLSVEGRVLDCRKQDGGYLVKMRLINLSRAYRELLQRLVKIIPDS